MLNILLLNRTTDMVDPHFFLSKPVRGCVRPHTASVGPSYPKRVFKSIIVKQRTGASHILYIVNAQTKQCFRMRTHTAPSVSPCPGSSPSTQTGSCVTS